jgi:hypothetical protein
VQGKGAVFASLCVRGKAKDKGKMGRLIDFLTLVSGAQLTLSEKIWRRGVFKFRARWSCGSRLGRDWCRVDDVDHHLAMLALDTDHETV